jgi:hypothetical protein
MQMDQIVPVDVTRFVLDLHRDFSVTPRATKPGLLAVTPKCSPITAHWRLDLYKTRRYIHAMSWIVTRKLQQQCRFKGGICVLAFRD